MSRLASLHYAQQRLTTSVRRLKRYRAVDFSQVTRLHFVCKGNICRSAYACVRAQMLGVEAISSGVHARALSAADAVAKRVAAQRDVDLSAHSANEFEGVVLGRGDLLVAMEPWHASAVATRADEFGAQVTLLGLWALPSVLIVEDPYGATDAQFATCFDLIDNGTARLAHLLRYRD